MRRLLLCALLLTACGDHPKAHVVRVENQAEEQQRLILKVAWSTLDDEAKETICQDVRERGAEAGALMMGRTDQVTIDFLDETCS